MLPAWGRSYPSDPGQFGQFSPENPMCRLGLGVGSARRISQSQGVIMSFSSRALGLGLPGI